MIQVQTPALDFLAPLVGLGGALSAALSLVLYVGLLVGILTPSIVVLLGFRMGSRYWRLPALWLSPSIVALLVVAFGVGAGPLGAGHAAGFTVYAGWALAAFVVGAPHLLIRFVRYIAASDASSQQPRSIVTRSLYGWGAVLAGVTVMLIGAAQLDAPGAWGVVLGILLLVIGGIHIRRSKSEPRPRPATFALRFVWLSGAILQAFAIPAALLFVATVIHFRATTEVTSSGSGISRGDALTVFVVLLAALGTATTWLAARRAPTN